MTRLTAVGAGAGGVLVVLGEAGVGKSRLLAEAARLAEEAGLVVLTGRAVAGGGTYRALAEALLPAVRDRADLPTAPGLRPYRAALARLLPGWTIPAGTPPPGGIAESAEVAGPAGTPGPGGAAGPAVDPAVDPAVVLAEGLLALLDRLAPAGCLLVLDDLHWADPETLALVDYLAAAAVTRPVLVAAAARDEGPVPDTLDRAARRPGGSPIWLARLGAADVAALAASRADGPVPDELLRQLAERADGLPLLVEELLSALTVPATTAPAPAARAGSSHRPSPPWWRPACTASTRLPAGSSAPRRCSAPTRTGRCSPRSPARPSRWCWTRWRPPPPPACSSPTATGCAGGTR